MTGVLTAGDRIREIVRLGREAREADALIESGNLPDWATARECDRWGEAVNGITDHLAALESTGVLEAIAEAADLFDGGRA